MGQGEAQTVSHGYCEGKCLGMLLDLTRVATLGMSVSQSDVESKVTFTHVFFSS